MLVGYNRVFNRIRRIIRRKEEFGRGVNVGALGEHIAA
jgi:hypothetical protein